MKIDAKFEKRGASSQGVALRPLRVLEELMHFHIRCAPLGLRLEVMRLAQPAHSGLFPYGLGPGGTIRHPLDPWHGIRRDRASWVKYGRFIK